MSIANGYVTLGELKQWLGIPSGDPFDDEILERAIEAASRSIDEFTARKFYLDSAASARTFHASTLRTVRVPDIGTTTGLVVKTDDNQDGSFETTISSSSLQFEPTYHDRLPINLIRCFSTSFPISSEGRELVQVTAKWGWPAIPPEVEQACLILASRWYKRKNSPEGVLSFADSGVIRISSTDRDVTALIQPFVLIGIG